MHPVEARASFLVLRKHQKNKKNKKIGVPARRKHQKKDIGVPARLHLQFRKKNAKFVSGPPPGSSETRFGIKKVKFQNA